MKTFLNRIPMILFLLITFTRCNIIPDKIVETLKIHPNDPFKNEITQSEYFDIDTKADTVIEGKNGTIVICPKGCFKNSDGEVVEGNIKLELTEDLSLDEMLLSNLTTTADGNPLETDGMIYLNATANGEQLIINKDNTLHVEIPTKHKKPGMMAYKGIRDEKGNMNWVEPKEIDNYLTPVDIDLLDFLPDGFKAGVEYGMPFKNYQTATKELIDSLYYSLSVSSAGDLTHQLTETHLNEPYYNKNKQAINFKYSKGSFVSASVRADTSMTDSTKSSNTLGIDPAIIKVIKSKKYNNTLIATKEFETRLQAIFKTCNNNVIEIYIKNLNKNMYQLDSLALEVIGESHLYETFNNFYLQKLTNVNGADKAYQLLSGYYEKQLSKIKSKLEKAKEKLAKQLDKKNDEAQKVANEYMNLLLERETYRMETYGFNMTATGWVNIDVGTEEKDWESNNLEMIVDNGKEYDRVYAYVVYTSIKSLYRLSTDDNQSFYVGNNEDKKILMPKKKMAIGIAVGYKGEKSALVVKEFETGTEKKFSFSLQASTKAQIKEAIKKYDTYQSENRISEDLKYMEKFCKEEQRQKQLMKEEQFIAMLRKIAHDCWDKPSEPASVPAPPMK